MTTNFKLTKKLAVKVLDVVDAGLCSGLGKPIPGHMCVEAAVCYAMGLEHSDQPTCVSPVLRSLKISLNDKNWSSNEARAKGLRRLAILQLGTADILDEKVFIKKLINLLAIKTVPLALVIASKLAVTEEHRKNIQEAIKKIKKEKNVTAFHAASAAVFAVASAASAASAASSAASAASSAAYAASTAAAYAASSAASAAYAAASAAYTASVAASAADAAADVRDKVLSDFAEDVCQILIKMKVPAVKYLSLTEKKK